VEESHNRGLEAVPLAGFRGKSPGQGGKPPEADDILLIGP